MKRETKEVTSFPRLHPANITPGKALLPVSSWSCALSRAQMVAAIWGKSSQVLIFW